MKENSSYYGHSYISEEWDVGYRTGINKGIEMGVECAVKEMKKKIRAAAMPKWCYAIVDAVADDILKEKK